VVRNSRAASVVTETMATHRPSIWVSDLYGAQQGHADLWQICLAHQLRDCKYAIEAGDTIFAPQMKALLPDSDKGSPFFGGQDGEKHAISGHSDRTEPGAVPAIYLASPDRWAPWSGAEVVPACPVQLHPEIAVPGTRPECDAKDRFGIVNRRRRQAERGAEFRRALRPKPASPFSASPRHNANVRFRYCRT
jgi:hypothetical protein